ncbi:MAG: two-component system response regulator CreB [Pseudomonadota bacterium]
MKPRILIVEDEPGIADTLQYALRTEGFEPHWVSTGAEALSHVVAQVPALVILDVGLPDASGFEIFKRLREAAGPALPVLFLTARSDEIDRVVGLELGADDYIAKPFSPRELVARVRTVLRRVGANGAQPSTPLSMAGAAVAAGAHAAAAGATAAASPSPLVVDDGRRQVRYYGQVLELSRYEYGLVKTLASRPGHVYTRDMLLSQVWGDDSESMDRTVDAHVKTVRAKMKAIAPALEPIRTHRGTGYALAEDLPPLLKD